MVCALGAFGPSPARAQGGVIVTQVTVSGLEVTLIAPREVRTGRPFAALAVVRHTGPGALEDAVATLGYDRAGMRNLTPAARHLGTLRPGRWRWVLWALRPKAPGEYALVAHVTGRERLTGAVVEADSPAVLVRVR